MKTIEVAKANTPLSEYVKDLDTGMLILTSNTTPIAAVVSLKNVDWESLSLSTNPEFMEIIEKSREEFKSGKRLSLKEMQQEISGNRSGCNEGKRGNQSNVKCKISN